MKLPKIILALLTVSLVATISVTIDYINKLSEDSLVGNFKTYLITSQKGWEKSDTVVLVNENSTSDISAAKPFAQAENAPILLTQKDKLNEKIIEELKRLDVKKTYLIGGEAVLSKSI